MRRFLLLTLAALVASAFVTGCAPTDQGGDYKEPDESSYKTQEQVPERAGRTKVEAGDSGGSGMGRSEGG